MHGLFGIPVDPMGRCINQTSKVDFSISESDLSVTCDVFVCFFATATSIKRYIWVFHGVSKNRGPPKSSILIGFSVINH